MIDLKDYLSSLVVGVNQARMLADFESARIAEIYAKDTILKNFSVPRFRTPDIELTIPVAVNSLESEYEKEYEPIDNVSFNSLTYTALKEVGQTDAFDRKTSINLRSVISTETDLLEKRIKADATQKTVALQSFSKNIAKLYVKNVDDAVDYEKLVTKIETDLTPHIASKQVAEMNTKVMVQANELKEVNPEHMIQIKMKLSEEGMEWHTINTEDGTTEQRLLPE